MKSNAKFLVSSLLSLFMLVPASVRAAGNDFSRGDTYCEIVWGVPPNFVVSWNGFGGVCPDSPGFYNVTVADVQAVHGADKAPAIIWNGIRQWTLDAFIPQEGGPTEASNGESVFYEYGSDIFLGGGGFVMRRQATVVLGFDGDDSSSTYDNPSMVARFQTAYFKANELVYELVAPNCSNIYAMQSVFIGRPGNFGVPGGIDELQTLGEKLSLPDGWTYRTCVLEEDLYIYGINGTTVVLQDDLGNSYSQHDKPFDSKLCESTTDTSSVSSLVPLLELGLLSFTLMLVNHA